MSGQSEQHNNNNEEENASPALHGVDIGQLLSSTGPLVQCVLLKAGENATVEQMELDTTPSKSMVAKTLGGPFTFLGQYEDEGIVLMVRQQQEEEEDDDALKQLSLSQLRSKCRDQGISMEGMLEKSDLVQALLQHSGAALPINQHKLQPPFDEATVRGDILVLKVAETNEVLDEEDDDGTDKKVEVPSNDEFFLDYTKDAYLKFAARTDIVAPEPPPDEEEEEEEEDNDEEEGDGDYVPLGEDDEDDDEEISEEDKFAMLNIVMGEVLRQFRQEHGRGPNTSELLEMRSALAQQLGVQVAELDATETDWSQKVVEDTPGAEDNEKKVVFSPDAKREDGDGFFNIGGGKEDDGEANNKAEHSEPDAKRRKLDMDQKVEEEASKPEASEVPEDT